VDVERRTTKGKKKKEAITVNDHSTKQYHKQANEQTNKQKAHMKNV